MGVRAQLQFWLKSSIAFLGTLYFKARQASNIENLTTRRAENYAL